MRKRVLERFEGVSNIELFYDLIFVYCISVITSLCHHPQGDFLDWNTYSAYLFSLLVVLQIWFYTVLLINRYGNRSASDNIMLFLNMFLLYFMANGISVDWASTVFTFNFAWALILLNVIVHWLIKRFRYSNLDEDDYAIIDRTVAVLSLQCVLVLVAAFMPAEISGVLSFVALAIGMAMWRLGDVYSRKPPYFAHLAERCSLLVIITFGEMVVGVSIYMSGGVDLIYPILVFTLVVGLFLIYMYEHDNMVDHNHPSDGMTYTTIHAWVILILGSLTIALEYMPDTAIALLPKSIFLTACLILYLLTSFLLGRFNKPQFTLSRPYAIGRIVVCIFILLVALFTNFDPLVNLICDTIAVYLALFHEWLLYHGRTAIVNEAREAGYTKEELLEAGYTFTTREGRQAIRESVRERRIGKRLEEAERTNRESGTDRQESNAQLKRPTRRKR